MNKIIITGRLGADAEMKETSNGSKLCEFRVGSDVGFGERKETLWFRCTLWGKRGESIANYLTKGMPVTVIGEFRYRTWEKETSGETMVSLEVNADEVVMQGSKGDGQSSPKREPKKERAPMPTGDDFSDDIPFAPLAKRNEHAI